MRFGHQHEREFELIAWKRWTEQQIQQGVKVLWQTGFGDGARDLPDVSLFSSDGQNGSFYILCQSDQDIPRHWLQSHRLFQLHRPGRFSDFQGGGGANTGSRAHFVGIMALVNQKTGQRQGTANFTLRWLRTRIHANCNSSSFHRSAGCTACFLCLPDVTKATSRSHARRGTPDCSKTGFEWLYALHRRTAEIIFMPHQVRLRSSYWTRFGKRNQSLNA